MTDLAIVKVNATGLPTAPIGDSSTIQVGQQAIAIGSPLGEFTDSVTSGIVSALGRSIDVEGSSLTNLIQTDTAINPGNSGGPLLDASGSVIGINTATSTAAQGIGFAIPIDIARPMLAQASAGQPLARAWLGVRFETITPTIQQEASLPVANGAWIPTASALQATPTQDPNAQGQSPFGQGQDPFGLGQGQDPNAQGGTGGQGSGSTSSIVANGPAAAAGLAEGDIITAVNGTSLDATHTLDLMVGQLAPGQAVDLTVLRSGQTTTVTVTLGTRPQSISPRPGAAVRWRPIRATHVNEQGPGIAAGALLRVWCRRDRRWSAHAPRPARAGATPARPGRPPGRRARGRSSARAGCGRPPSAPRRPGSRRRPGTPRWRSRPRRARCRGS